MVNTPQRTWLKDFLALLTILAFSMMICQVYLSRVQSFLNQGVRLPRIVRVHKAIGYFFIAVLVLHPVFIVLPRYFEAGVTPVEAFLKMITEVDNLGIVLGLVAYAFMLLVGITAMFRNKLPINYRQWRVLHAVLSFLFIAVATWHAVDLGRHMDRRLSAYLMSSRPALSCSSSACIPSPPQKRLLNMNEPKSDKNLSRRDFIAVTAGAASFAALAAMTMRFNAGWEENKPTVKPGEIQSRTRETDVLVIGGGIAGLFAAVKAHDAGANVLLVSKGALGSSGQTPFAKGIFAYDPAKGKISLDEFVDKVSYSALGTNNPIYTRQMAEHSAARVAELREWGFFDSPLYFKSFRTPIDERAIPVKERITITHLIKENGHIAGAAGFSLDDECVWFFKAKTVILCTGAGGFKPNGFPICDLTHDGTVMAYQIGAKVTGKEWNDGHPGAATNPAACLRRLGHGRMFDRKPGTTGVGIRHDLGVDMNYQAYVSGASPPEASGTGRRKSHRRPGPSG